MYHLKIKASYVIGGLIVCGVAGYFIGGSDGRAVGGGIGIRAGMVAGGLVRSFRPTDTDSDSHYS